MPTFTVGNGDGTAFTDSGTTSDGATGGAGSLSLALAQANATTDPVVITLTSNVSLTGPLSPIFNPNVTIDGNGFSITSTSQRIFFVGTDTANQLNGARQTLTLNDLTLTGSATGGAGAGRGGGGLGAGGAIFVNQTGDVVLNNVDLTGNRATGGAAGAGGAAGGGGGGLGGAGGGGGGGGLYGGGSSSGGGGGGGGGLFGNGGGGGDSAGGGGGGFSGGGGDADGGAGERNSLDIAGRAGSGASGISNIGQNSVGGANGGGGGGGGRPSSEGNDNGAGGGGGFGGSNINGAFGGGGGGAGLGNGIGGLGGAFGGGGGGAGQRSNRGGGGGFGGGGGSGGFFGGGGGGFGGGGGGGVSNGGRGGFGGGGGDSNNGGGGSVFAGGDGSNGQGGGGALGGAVFVTAGGTLTVNGTSSESGSQLGASAGGQTFGAGIFFQGAAGGGTPATLRFGAGDQSYASQIADLNGAAGNTTTANGLGGTGGAMAIAKSGTGSLRLGATNTYTGGTFVEGGSVVAGAAGAFGSGAVHMVDPTVVFDATGTQANVFSLDGADPAADPNVFQVNAGITATLSGGIVTGTGTNSLGQAIAADQPLVVTGPGSLVLTNTGSYTGGTTITGGATVTAGHVNNNVFLDAVGSGSVTLDDGTLAFGVGANVANAISVTANGGTLDAGAVTSNNVILRSGLTGTGPLTLAGTNSGSGSTGRLVLQADNSGLTGPVTIARGAVGASAANALSPNAALTVDAGASLDLNAQAGTTSQTVGSLAGGGAITASNVLNGGTPTAVSLTAGGNDTSTVFSGTLGDGQGAALGLVKTGTGTLSLLGTSNFTGTTAVNAGILNVQNASALGAGDSTANTGTSVANGATLQLQAGAQGDITVGSEALAITGSGSGNRPTVALQNVAGANTFGGPITYTGSARIESGAGTLTLANTVTGDGVGLLSLGGTGNGLVSGDIVTGPPNTNGLSKDGAGTWTLSGSNSFNGVGVTDGTLRLASTTALGTSFANVFDNATLDVNGGTAGLTISNDLNIRGTGANGVGALTGTGTTGVTGTVRLLNDATVGTTSATDNLTLSGPIVDLSGNGYSLTKVGTGTLSLTGTSTYTGGTTITGGVLELGAAGAAGSGAIGFSSLSGSATATLSLTLSAQPTDATFSNTLADFNASSRLDLQRLANGSVSYNSANSSITVTGQRGSDPVTQTFLLSNPSSTAFITQDNGQGGTVVLVCYVTGTRIRVWRDEAEAEAEVAVEDLRVGDVAVTADGTHRPIRWIGSRPVEAASFAEPSQVWPVRLRAGAFGAGMPARDLLVSPDHAVRIGPEHGFAGEALVPAFALVNGATVVREPVAAVTYWHVEVEGGHALLLAEGLAAESYLDVGNRGFFAGADGRGDPGRDAPASCLPRTDDPTRLAPVRVWLRVQALSLGWRCEAAEPLSDLRIVADGVTLAAETRGLSARVLVPAGAREVWLVSAAAVPWEVSDTADARRLGTCVAGLWLSDGWDPPVSLALDAANLTQGWHAAEAHGEGHLRWTDGRAMLPSQLWADGTARFLRLDLARPGLPRWQAPAALLAAAAEAGPHLRPLRSHG